MKQYNLKLALPALSYSKQLKTKKIQKQLRCEWKLKFGFSKKNGFDGPCPIQKKVRRRANGGEEEEKKGKKKK